MSFKLIVAVDSKKGIGLDNRIPWHIPEDLKRFKKLTEGQLVIMGRKTWQSLPMKPLKNRINIIISKTLVGTKYPDTFIVNSFIDCLKLTNKFPSLEKFIIGGRDIYQFFLKYQKVDTIFETRVLHDYQCDVLFEENNTFPDKYYLQDIVKNQDDELKYEFRTYRLNLKPHSEYQYLNLVEKILLLGEERQDRTGVGTISRFAPDSLTFDLTKGFPLLTTKKMFFRGIKEELLWFISGSTDNSILREKRVKIWNGNSERNYLDKIGLNHLKENDCGPIYGFNFRHYGANYIDCKTNYIGKGIDQLQNVIELIKNDPFSRRILINLWNPTQLNEVSLPACHVLYQFYVSSDKKHLSCSMYQRSGDLGLGVPFNIASAALLTHLIGKATNKIPLKLTITLGDAHIYKNHIDSLKAQLGNIPKCFPLLQLTDKNCIFDFHAEDITLIGYESHSRLEMDMAV